MIKKIAINGFGRIGRVLFKQIINDNRYEIKIINDPASTEMMSYLLKHDTTLGTMDMHNEVETGCDFIAVNGKHIHITHEIAPDSLSWGKHDIDVVIDCSGAYLTKIKAQKHLDAGAKKVILSAPAGHEIPTVVYGVNTEILTPDDRIISAASCSTNALAPMVQALSRYANILAGNMLTVHGYTASQVLVDNAQKNNDFRRSRAAACNIIPTSAEAATAVGRVIPSLNGKLYGSAVRVPVQAGCYINFIAEIQRKNATIEELNDVMKSASSEFFGYTEEELVSSDIIGIRYASLFDATQTEVCRTSQNTFQTKLSAWFDNESSFVSQIIRCLSIDPSKINKTIY
ncbi:type I glyceraldehyde-3-phosphate dehydrogenase [Deferribacteres bacterium DY0037]